MNHIEFQKLQEIESMGNAYRDRIAELKKELISIANEIKESPDKREALLSLFENIYKDVDMSKELARMKMGSE